MAQSAFRILDDDPAFMATSEIRDFCYNGALLLRPLENELVDAAKELRDVLRYVRIDGSGATESAVKARIVAAHMRRAAGGIDVTRTELRRTYLSFRKHFVPQSQLDRPRPKFNIDG